MEGWTTWREKRFGMRSESSEASKQVKWNSAQNLVTNLASVSPILQTPMHFLVSVSDRSLFYIPSEQ